MGTYLRFQVPKKHIRSFNAYAGQMPDVAEMLRVSTSADVKAAAKEPWAGTVREGVGEFKLSGLAHESGLLPRAAQVLAEARSKFDMTLENPPSNIGDYFTEEELRGFMDVDAHRAKVAEDAALSTEWQRARNRAYELACSKMCGGATREPIWGRGFAQLMYARVGLTSQPAYMRMYYGLQGGLRSVAAPSTALENCPDLRSELFRDKNGDVYMGCPLLPLNPGGNEEAFNFLLRAREVGLRGNPYAQFLRMYGCAAFEKFEPVKGFTAADTVEFVAGCTYTAAPASGSRGGASCAVDRGGAAIAHRWHSLEWHYPDFVVHEQGATRFWLMHHTTLANILELTLAKI